MAIRDRGLLDRPPALRRPQPTGDRAGEAELRRLPESRGRVRVPQRLCRQFERDLRGADVARLGHDLFDAQQAVRVRVADRAVADRQLAGGRLDLRVGPHLAGLERRHDREWLHRRTGLERVGQHPVADGLAAELAARVRVVRRQVRQRQQFAASRVDHDGGARLRVVLLERRLQCGVRDVLHPVVDRQRQVPPVERLAQPVVLDDAAEPVLDHATAAGTPGQQLLVGELDAFLPAVLDVREADDVRAGRTLGVVALELAAGVNAGDLQVGDARGDVGVDLAPQVDEGAVVVGEPPLHFAGVHAEQARQLRDLLVRGLDVFGNRPDRLRRHGRGEHDAVAVRDAAARRRDLERAGVARLALPLQEVRRHAAHQVEGAPRERHERAEQQEQHQLRAPGRQRHGEQRVRVEPDALAPAAALARAGGSHAGRRRLLHFFAPGASGAAALAAGRFRKTVRLPSTGFIPSRRASAST